MYADDDQVYFSFTCQDYNELVTVKQRIELCMVEINNWMILSKLKLNTDKTELLVLHSKFCSHIPFGSLMIVKDAIFSRDHVRNTGVIFDEIMSYKNHIQTVVKSSFNQLRNIAKMRKYVSVKIVKTLVMTLVISRIDNCNALMFGLPNYMISKLQNVQNAAARVIVGARKYDHITPVLKDLH